MIITKNKKDFAGFTECKSKGKVYPQGQSIKDFWTFNVCFVAVWLILFVLCIITV